MGDDTAALVVALSAQLTKFESDMKGAVDVADRRTKEIETRFATMNATLVAGLAKTTEGIGVALSGVASSFLGAAGISGLGMAALLATAVSLNGELAKIPGLARLAGVSTDRLQEIKFAGALKGVGDDAFTTSLDASVKLLDEAQRQVNTLSRLFNANGLSIRDQNGDLIKFDQLLTIAAQLMVNTRSETEKFKIAEMLGLSKEWVAVLRNGPDEFKAAAAGARDAGAVIDKQLLDRAKEFDQLWTATVVKFKAGFVSTLADLAEAFKEFWSKLVDSVPGASFVRDKLQEWAGGLTALTLPELRDVLKRSIEQGLGDFEISRIQAEIDRRTGTKPLRVTVTPELSDTPTVIPKDKQRNAFDSAVFETNKRIAATEAETRTIGLNSEARDRAKLVAELEEAAKKANTDAGYQNATVTDIQRDKINQLADAMEAASRRQRESHQQLFQFAVDGRNFAKQFDSFAVSAFGNVETGLTAFITGTKTAKDAFTDMANSILADLTKMIIRMTITAPLAASLGGMFQGGLGSTFGAANGSVLPGGLPLGQGGIGHNAAGTDDWRGGPTWVGESGPEIVNLPRGAQVVPNDVARSAGGGSSAINVRMSLDLKGANGDETIARIASAAARQAFAGAVKVANDSAPSRQRRYRMLGT